MTSFRETENNLIFHNRLDPAPAVKGYTKAPFAGRPPHFALQLRLGRLSRKPNLGSLLLTPVVIW
ncbi:MAG: hypothetical protein A2139_04465 [Desulfobacca sp. RBG_16_60_12]|nr:MAG: hypothetical protein A2139_04465 [Desulfobacca sp. RBG_16_60_12]